MTVDRTHVLATPGMDARGSYVALSVTATARTCIMAATTSSGDQNRLVRTLSRDRAKDMAAWITTRRRLTPSGVASHSANVLPRSSGRSCRRRCATGSAECSTVCV